VRVVASLSEHPLATHAVGECVGALLEGGGLGPDLLAVFATGPHLGALEDIVAASRALLSPGVTIGAGASSVLAGSREVEEHSALAVLGLWTDHPEGPTPIRLVSDDAVAGLAGRTGTLLVIADPFSCDAEQLLSNIRAAAPELRVLGGLVSLARQRGGNRLILDDGLHAEGAVGLLLDPQIPVTGVVSQGCRPIGDPLTVTAAERNIISQLAGAPALERLLSTVETLGPADRQLVVEGLRIGRVIDEQRDEFGRGDFLVRNVLGADRDTGALAVAESVDVGSTVQFQLRDAASASEDLVEMLDGRTASGALVFTCTGRGSGLFGIPDHDAAMVTELLGGAPIAGMFTGAEFGPVGSVNFVHSFSASVALFG
jgi:small ligand-binding sensory domain FIST